MVVSEIMQNWNDSELIRAYADSSNEEAFAELVSRHQKLVFFVCRRMLGNAQEAEDAVQAVFLVLARSADGLRREGGLAGWLHKVARNVSLDALRQRARYAREKEAAMMNAVGMHESYDSDVKGKVLSFLDEEVVTLPKSQRDAVILRYLEGYSQEDAARLAGCPLSALRNRASRGIEKLRQRLERHGVAVGSVALAGMLEVEAGATVPSTLMPSILSTVKSAAAGSQIAGGDAVADMAARVLKMMFWDKVRTAAIVVLSAATLGAGGALGVKGMMAAAAPEQPVQAPAVKAPEQPEVKGPLADRPSKPGSHLDKIKAMGANTWLNLGKPAGDPTYGGAQGRSWSRKMAYSPDLRGAFLYGSGYHGGASVRGGKLRYNDDLFFYDINAHAWICCHPGTLLDPKSKKGHNIPDASITLDPVTRLNLDKDGNIIPVGTSVHSYWTPEYDTDRKLFLFMPSTDMFGFQVTLTNWHSSNAWSTEYSPYYYNGRTGKFDRRKATSPSPVPGCDTGVFYSPKIKKVVYFKDGVWQYDYAGNYWKRVNADGGSAPAYCYDSRRDQVYTINVDRAAKGTNNVAIYDISSNKWTKVDCKGAIGTWLDSNDAFFTYDSANDVALLYVRDMHYVFSQTNNTWVTLPKTFPKQSDDWRRGNGWVSGSGFYDPELNVHFYYNAWDSDTWPGDMWVYRYGPGDSQEQSAKETK